MITEKFWSKELFPIVYENNQAKAIIMDMKTFEKIELILDNLMNRDPEPEDNILSKSELSEKMVNEARKTSPSKDWRSELDGL